MRVSSVAARMLRSQARNLVRSKLFLSYSRHVVTLRADIPFQKSITINHCMDRGTSVVPTLHACSLAMLVLPIVRN